MPSIYPNRAETEMMSIWGFWEHIDTVDPIIIVSQTVGGKKKEREKQVIGVPSQHQTTCCAAGFCRVLGPNLVVQAFQLFGGINGTWAASQMIEGGEDRPRHAWWSTEKIGEGCQPGRTRER